ncbi:MAG: hypothetical protein H6923_09025 [Alphaproteobacteria bacterium]|nr:hypothetical protein [Alphaproteobacteria bacterium]
MAEPPLPPETETEAQTRTKAAARRRRVLTMIEGLGRDPTSGEGKKGAPGWLPPVAFATAVIAVVAVAFSLVLGPKSDHVTDAQKNAWATAFAAAAPIAVKTVPFAESKTAIAAMKLPPAQEQAMETAVQSGQVRLVWITVQDVVVEDGDWVRIQSEGYETEVMIRNAATKVYLPEPSSGIINILGTKDGGGGITISITSGGAPVNLPFMEVGQEFGIPVVVSP